jgi:hypothetical protein
MAFHDTRRHSLASTLLPFHGGATGPNPVCAPQFLLSIPLPRKGMISQRGYQPAGRASTSGRRSGYLKTGCSHLRGYGSAQALARFAESLQVHNGEEVGNAVPDEGQHPR